jgi:hypothetical protein
MAVEDTIHTDLRFETMMSGLFGKASCHASSGHLDALAWRSQLKRIMHGLGVAIHESVQGDDRYRDEIVVICKEAEAKLSSLRNTKALSVWAIFYLTRIAFSLVGQMPKHWDCRSTTNRRLWRLTHHRTLFFGRTAAQRATMLQDLPDDPGFAGLPKRTEMQRAFREQCNSQPELFFEWFKTRFPQVYARVAQV